MPQSKLPNQSKVWTCIMINLAATPGLGSVMCRRMIAGLGQLALSVSGFCLILVWMMRFFYNLAMEQVDAAAQPPPPGWLWQTGAICFGAGWLWSLATSFSLLREAKKNERLAQQTVPPRIADFPGGTPRV